MPATPYSHQQKLYFVYLYQLSRATHYTFSYRDGMNQPYPGFNLLPLP